MACRPGTRAEIEDGEKKVEKKPPLIHMHSTSPIPYGAVLHGTPYSVDYTHQLEQKMLPREPTTGPRKTKAKSDQKPGTSKSIHSGFAQAQGLA